MITDPLKNYHSSLGFDPERIEKLVIGKKYAACLLRNGHLGVCATLLHPFPAGYTLPEAPDLEQRCDRIVYQAWLNAMLNNDRHYSSQGDIFQTFTTKPSARVTMIGYFGPLIRRFRQAGIPLSVFDYHPHDDTLPIEQRDQHLAESEWVILTSTAISNQSFASVLSATRDGSRVLLLGPSTIMHPDMLLYPHIAGLYGMVFPPRHEQVQELIREGAGTPEFGKFGTKVIIHHE